MKKIVLAITTMLLTSISALAQTAASVLDKCAATVSSPNGVTAKFTMESAKYGNASGTISIKGKKFYLLSTALLCGLTERRSGLIWPAMTK